MRISIKQRFFCQDLEVFFDRHKLMRSHPYTGAPGAPGPAGASGSSGQHGSNGMPGQVNFCFLHENYLPEAILRRVLKDVTKVQSLLSLAQSCFDFFWDLGEVCIR